MDRWLIGWFARKVGAVPVGRALDMVKPGPGTIYLPDLIEDPLLVRGVGTKFDDGKLVQVGGLLVLPSVNGTAANAEIAQIISAEEIKLKKPFKGKAAMSQMTGRVDVDDSGKFTDLSVKGTVAGFEGSIYKVAPKVDQTQVYDAVFDRLSAGGAVGIFPEGGSHDRTELLPLKAGVAIMALGALAANPDCGLKIVPCGMNYSMRTNFDLGLWSSLATRSRSRKNLLNSTGMENEERQSVNCWTLYTKPWLLSQSQARITIPSCLSKQFVGFTIQLAKSFRFPWSSNSTED